MERASLDNTPAHISSSEVALAAGGSSNDNIVAVKNDDEGAEVLASDFDPGKWDVICQRGKECFDHGMYTKCGQSCVCNGIRRLTLASSAFVCTSWQSQIPNVHRTAPK
jgi:hypothetical protein